MRHFGAAITRDDARSMVSPFSLLGLGPVLLDGLPSIEVGNSSCEENVAHHAPLWKSESEHRRLARRIGQSRLTLSLASYCGRRSRVMDITSNTIVGIGALNDTVVVTVSVASRLDLCSMLIC